MNIFLTFDIEIWCNGWSRLDKRFPAAFDRYIFGRSRSGAFALPKTLEILNRYRIKGVFFVEPLFSARFGAHYLRTICQLIQDAGQDIQLHLHPEWTDEITPALFPDKPYKRQHLIHYDRQEQVRLIQFGRALLEEATGTPVTAFRAGSFAVNADTLAALNETGLTIDASIDVTSPISAVDLKGDLDLTQPQRHGALQLIPLSVFRDGFGRLRHAQIGACSVQELQQAMQATEHKGDTCFTVLSHNFELLRSGRAEPDWIVVKRFERFCRFLDRHRDRYPTQGFANPPALPAAVSASTALPRVGRLATLIRYYEQAHRRFLALSRID